MPANKFAPTALTQQAVGNQSQRDENIYKNLDEVNLRYGRDIILTFNGLDCSVIFGRGNEAKKIIYLHALWKKLNGKNNLFKESEYIDLRYRDKIFIGKKIKTETTG